MSKDDMVDKLEALRRELSERLDGQQTRLDGQQARLDRLQTRLDGRQMSVIKHEEDDVDEDEDDDEDSSPARVRLASCGLPQRASFSDAPV